MNRRLMLAFVLLGWLGAAIGAELPPHWQRSYPDLDGKQQVLDQWRGRIVMVNFWATWCPPCLHEIPSLVRFQKAHQDEVQIIGIGMDEPQKLKNTVRTLSINYPVLVTDPRDNIRLLAQWGNQRGVVPYTVFFDADGIIRILHRGPLDDERLESYLAELKRKDS